MAEAPSCVTMPADPKTPERFSLKRWSRRKREAVRSSAESDPRPVVSAPIAAENPAPAAVAPAADVAPALPPVESLTPESDFAAFMQPEIDDGLKRQALKKLFADPHFNVMDGLDVYIDDYTKTVPIPASVLERLMKLGFVRDQTSVPDKEQAPPEAAAPMDSGSRVPEIAGDAERVPPPAASATPADPTDTTDATGAPVAGPATPEPPSRR